MADLTNNVQEEAPIDPATEALRRKMIRLMVLSIGSMFVGIFAVLFAVVYKINDAPNASDMVDTVVNLPQGFTIEESHINDGVLMLRGSQAEEGVSILMFDAVTGEARGKITLK